MVNEPEKLPWASVVAVATCTPLKVIVTVMLAPHDLPLNWIVPLPGSVTVSGPVVTTGGYCSSPALATPASAPNASSARRPATSACAVRRLTGWPSFQFGGSEPLGGCILSSGVTGVQIRETWVFRGRWWP